MSEFKGTKDIWYINRWGNITSESSEIAYMPSLTSKEQKEANALLISKAPEMLDMLKDIKDYLGSDKRQEVEQLIKEATQL